MRAPAARRMRPRGTARRNRASLRAGHGPGLGRSRRGSPLSQRPELGPSVMDCVYQSTKSSQRPDAAGCGSGKGTGLACPMHLQPGEPRGGELLAASYLSSQPTAQEAHRRGSPPRRPPSRVLRVVPRACWAVPVGPPSTGRGRWLRRVPGRGFQADRVSIAHPRQKHPR